MGIRGSLYYVNALRLQSTLVIIIIIIIIIIFFFFSDWFFWVQKN